MYVILVDSYKLQQCVVSINNNNSNIIVYEPSPHVFPLLLAGEKWEGERKKEEPASHGRRRLDSHSSSGWEGKLPFMKVERGGAREGGIEPQDRRRADSTPEYHHHQQKKELGTWEQWRFCNLPPRTHTHTHT